MTAQQRNIGAELCERLACIGDSLALTDEEREAISEAAKAYADNDGDDSRTGIAATLFRLLDRTRP